MRHRFSLLVATALVMSACSTSPASPTGASPTITSLEITGSSSLDAPGQTTQLTATAKYADGTMKDVTSSATWQSSNPAVGAVTSGGLVTALTAGGTTVTGTYQGKVATFGLTIRFSFSPNNSLTATIDGAPFAGAFVAALLDYGRLGVTGSSAGPSTPITLLVIDLPQAAGTYSLTTQASSQSASALLAIVDPSLPPAQQLSMWGSAGGSGTITVSTFTSNSASGTFSLTLAPLPFGLATGTKTVANGSFNVTF